MKLVQIKEFRKDNLTNEFVFNLFAIAGLWNHYTEVKRIEKGYEVKEVWCGRNKGVSSHSEDWDNPEFQEGTLIRTFDGLRLKPLCGTSHEFRLWSDGHINAYNVNKKGDLKSVGSEGIKYYEEDSHKLEYPCNQIQLIQLYLAHKFYTIENV